jgi:hypothetical protein
MRLVGKKYSGEEGERFGPTLAAEHLASDDQVEVNAQTLRRWMLAEGLWSRARKRRLHRKRRERKEHVGELVQMDGSFHDWLEERGPRSCLMNMVDDASGDTLARMGGGETIWICCISVHPSVTKSTCTRSPEIYSMPFVSSRPVDGSQVPGGGFPPTSKVPGATMALLIIFGGEAWFPHRFAGGSPLPIRKRASVREAHVDNVITQTIPIIAFMFISGLRN